MQEDITFPQYYINELLQFFYSNQDNNHDILFSIQCTGDHPIIEYIDAYAKIYDQDPLEVYHNNAEFIAMVKSHHVINQVIIQRMSEIKDNIKVNWFLNKGLEIMEVAF